MIEQVGVGPPDQKCGSCVFHVRAFYHSRYYWKCWMQRRQWTHGLKTDIRKRDPACRLYEQRPEDEPPKIIKSQQELRDFRA